LFDRPNFVFITLTFVRCQVGNTPCKYKNCYYSHRLKSYFLSQLATH